MLLELGPGQFGNGRQGIPGGVRLQSQMHDRLPHRGRKVKQSHLCLDMAPQRCRRVNRERATTDPTAQAEKADDYPGRAIGGGGEQSVNLLHQFVGHYRFGHVRIGAAFQRRIPIDGLGPRRQDQDRQRGDALGRPDLLAQLMPADSRHHDVEQQYVRFFLINALDPLRRIVFQDRRVASPLQHHPDHS